MALGAQPDASKGMRWAAAACVGVWCAGALVFGLYGFIERTAEARAQADPANLGWDNPFSLELGAGIAFVWIVLTLNLVLPAIGLGLAAITSGGSRRFLRASTYAALVVLGVAGQFWGNHLANREPSAAYPSTWNVVADGRIGYALMSLTAIAVAIGSLVLLDLRRGRKN
ncbi:MAG: hypothetical protein QOG53_1341 [Frankiales bacterium]|nr:hypothetical protein [Frankiales bacterium]